MLRKFQAEGPSRNQVPEGMGPQNFLPISHPLHFLEKGELGDNKECHTLFKPGNSDPTLLTRAPREGQGPSIRILSRAT